MIDIKIEGADLLQKKMLAYGKAVNKEAGDIIDDIATSGARYLANNTKPYGLSNKTKDVLVNSIYKDIARAYRTSDKATQTDSGEYLDSVRNSKGRVPRGTKPKFITSESFQSIKREKAKNAGVAKSAWLQSIKNLKSKTSIPAWLRKDRDLGTAKKSGSDIKTEISLTNKADYASDVITSANIAKSLGMAYKNYIKFIDRKMAALAKRI